jgi:hypothetical protein
MSFPVLGVVGGAVGIALGWMALRRRARIRAAWAASRDSGVPPGRPINPSLRAIADIASPIMLLGLIIAGVQVAIAFVITDGGGIFSALDLVGFLLLLLGYGFWFHTRTMFRMDRAPD